MALAETPFGGANLVAALAETLEVASPGQTPRVSRRGTALTAFTRMPKPQHIDGRILDFITYLIVPNEDAPYFAGRKFFQSFTNAGIGQQ